jgi:hypothetical protein
MSDTAKIRALNDALRRGERPDLGRFMITSGVRDLAAAWPLGKVAVYAKVQAFDAFTKDNDPYFEQDFGSFEFAGVTCYFKIDHLDKAMKCDSEGPADETKTTRLLVIMRADEY